MNLTDYLKNKVVDGLKFSDDNKKAWSAANKLLTSFVNNDTITTNTDGTTQNEKTNLSKAVKPKADN